jgi:hypothetical protein
MQEEGQGAGIDSQYRPPEPPPRRSAGFRASQGHWLRLRKPRTRNSVSEEPQQRPTTLPERQESQKIRKAVRWTAQHVTDWAEQVFVEVIKRPHNQGQRPEPRWDRLQRTQQKPDGQTCSEVAEPHQRESPEPPLRRFLAVAPHAHPPRPEGARRCCPCQPVRRGERRTTGYRAARSSISATASFGSASSLAERTVTVGMAPRLTCVRIRSADSGVAPLSPE